MYTEITEITNTVNPDILQTNAITDKYMSNLLVKFADILQKEPSITISIPTDMQMERNHAGFVIKSTDDSVVKLNKIGQQLKNS